MGKAEVGFEPTNNGFAIRPLSPLGYSAESLFHARNLAFLGRNRSSAVPPRPATLSRGVHRRPPVRASAAQAPQGSYASRLSTAGVALAPALARLLRLGSGR